MQLGANPLFFCWAAPISKDISAFATFDLIRTVRKGELLAIQWPQLNFENSELLASKKVRDESWPDSPWAFNRGGQQIKDFRGGWF